MDFFPPPPPDDEPAEKWDPNATPWMGPPDNVLGGLVPIERFLARTGSLVLILEDATVYEDGVLFRVRAAARRPADMEPGRWRELCESLYRQSFWEDESGETGHHPDRLLRFGVRFPDGTKVTTVDRRDRGPSWPLPRPESPVLSMQGGSSGSGGDRARAKHTLWMWPLPPATSFELALEWPQFGIPLTFTELNGAELVEASRRARPYWP